MIAIILVTNISQEMLSYEELVDKSRQLDRQIDESLKHREQLRTKEVVLKSKQDYQRNAYVKKLHEKLNLVIVSRVKAQESNKRLLADFDRIQKHLDLMDMKTKSLIAKVDAEKKHLDENYPNWREKANMFVSPAYITQENMFNMLDSLRCRLSHSTGPGNGTFHKFSQSGLKFEDTTNLASMLDHSKHTNYSENEKQKNTTKMRLDLSNQDLNYKNPEDNFDSNMSMPERKVSKSRDHDIVTQASDHLSKTSIPIERTSDTLTNITESSVSIRMRGESRDMTEDALSPRPSLADTETDTELSSRLSPRVKPFSYQLPTPRKEISDDMESDSEGGIENLLSPEKRDKKQAPVLPGGTPRESQHDEKLPESPGGSVDTVVKSPVRTSSRAPPKLSTPVLQVCFPS